MLLELAKTEGVSQMTNVNLEGVPYEVINKEFIDKLPDKGIFEGTYICQQANINEEVRQKMGEKYLDWH